MSAPLKAMRLKTPARIFHLTETETSNFGLTQGFAAGGLIWGDFAPDDPKRQMPGEGEAYFIQAAGFVCRADQSLMRGAQLRIDGADWVIMNLIRDADGYVRLGLERVLPHGVLPHRVLP